MIILISLTSLYMLWVMYLAVMALKRARDSGKLSKPAMVLGYPLLFIGLVLDALVNITLGSVLMLELPREWLVTARLTRHINTGSGWRKKLALWVTATLLDAFDPRGVHR